MNRIRRTERVASWRKVVVKDDRKNISEFGDVWK